MLLNTSLNIKGEPMINNHEDADKWSKTYGLPVFN
jgi:carbamoyltransferase